ncbi:esterase-like activity of phytase family protein [Marinicella sp. W31]|uniref:esterase-like activity of phytase family protein n=1 Tax=Marinicella sp. W31 TaxID=3023713 RepID=UPI0037567AF4
MGLTHLKLLFIVLVAGCASQPALHTDINWRALPVDSEPGTQPSGLCLVEGQLFAVSDKHDWIYRIDIEADRAVMRKHVPVDSAALGVEKLDLEGITADQKGNFILLSERHNRLLRVNAKGTRWLPGKELEPAAQQAGLLRKHNAGFEGVTFVAPNRLLLAAEREPRGLVDVELSPQYNIKGAIVTLFQFSVLPFPEDRPPDFAGLDFFAGQTYVLQRNINAISILNRRVDGFREGQAWSFSDVLESPQWRYQDMRFGHAEGLAVDAENFYVILDNNNSALQSNPSDKRSLLLIGQRH